MNLSKKFFFLFLFFTFMIKQPELSYATSSGSVQKTQILPGLNTYSKTLKNGLTVVLTPNKNAPLTSIFHWVKAGSLHETPGITGIAHLFEHMMFRPLKKGVPGFFDLSRAIGADVNANTRYESTVYTTTVPHHQLTKALQLEANRFRNLKVNDELLNLEREAVRSEYSTKMDVNPIMDLWMSLFKTAYQGHAFGWTIVGFREDLDKIKASDCNAFFEKYYTPSNVGLFVAGNFEPNALFAQIESIYGSWKTGVQSALPKAFLTTNEEKEGTGLLKSQAKDILIGYRIPYFTKDNALILETINDVLIESKQSLVKKRLLYDKKIVADIGGFNFSYDNGLIEIFTTLLPQTSYSKILSELDQIPDDFKKMTEANWNTYLEQIAISSQEGLLRNQTLNENLAKYWGKYGDFTLLKQTFEPGKWLTKKQAEEWIDLYWKKENRTWVQHKD